MSKQVKQVDRLREDAMWCASQFQNHPDKIARAIMDADTRKEMQTLVGDLFSLLEVILNEEN